MARKAPTPKTQLGTAIQRARDGKNMLAVAKELSLSETTLSRLERGVHQPTIQTAYVLSKWLGWSIEQIFEAGQQSA